MQCRCSFKYPYIDGTLLDAMTCTILCGGSDIKIQLQLTQSAVAVFRYARVTSYYAEHNLSQYKVSLRDNR
jgi:hypothetical protein